MPGETRNSVSPGIRGIEVMRYVHNTSTAKSSADHHVFKGRQTRKLYYEKKGY